MRIGTTTVTKMSHPHNQCNFRHHLSQHPHRLHPTHINLVEIIIGQEINTMRIGTTTVTKMSHPPNQCNFRHHLSQHPLWGIEETVTEDTVRMFHLSHHRIWPIDVLGIPGIEDTERVIEDQVATIDQGKLHKLSKYKASVFKKLHFVEGKAESS
jgi:hypothetical protein